MDSARQQLLSSLRQQLDHWQSAYCAAAAGSEAQFRDGSAAVISSGCGALDRLLPQGGFLPGQLVEWLGDAGCGSGMLAMLVARQAARASFTGDAIVVIDASSDFYPPAAADWGIHLSRLIVVRPALALAKPSATRSKKKQTRAERQANFLWALDQSLRCPAVAAVWSYLPSIDARNFRRLQLAAEEGRTLALFVRDANVRGQPSWSDMQIHVRSLPSRSVANQPVTSRRLQIELLRCRRGTAGASLELEIDEIEGRIRSPVPTIHPLTNGHPLNTGHPSATGNEYSSSEQLPSDSHNPGQARALHLASQLARPAAGRRSARA